MSCECQTRKEKTETHPNYFETMNKTANLILVKFRISLSPYRFLCPSKLPAVELSAADGPVTLDQTEPHLKFNPCATTTLNPFERSIGCTVQQTGFVGSRTAHPVKTYQFPHFYDRNKFPGSSH